MAGWKANFKEGGTLNRFENLKRRVWGFRSRLNWTDIGVIIGVAVFFSFFFYRSVWAFVFMVPAGGIFVVQRQKRRKKKKEQSMLLQFKECVLSVSASLNAGYAVENAFAESIKDMEIMFGKDCEIVEELSKLCRGLQNNETMETLLQDLAHRSGLEELVEFAEVFAIAKRNSGNIPATIEIYSRIITNKLELQTEIETLLSAKRLEQRVMNIMPFFIVLYLEYTNPGYFNMMYHNILGVGIMTLALVVYMTAYVLSERIFEKAFG